jgi:hypothetical protein
MQANLNNNKHFNQLESDKILNKNEFKKLTNSIEALKQQEAILENSLTEKNKAILLLNNAKRLTEGKLEDQANLLTQHTKNLETLQSTITKNQETSQTALAEVKQQQTAADQAIFEQKTTLEQNQQAITALQNNQQKQQESAADLQRKLDIEKKERNKNIAALQTEQIEQNTHISQLEQTANAQSKTLQVQQQELITLDEKTKKQTEDLKRVETLEEFKRKELEAQLKQTTDLLNKKLADVSLALKAIGEKKRFETNLIKELVSFENALIYQKFQKYLNDHCDNENKEELAAEYNKIVKECRAQIYKGNLADLTFDPTVLSNQEAKKTVTDYACFVLENYINPNQMPTTEHQKKANRLKRALSFIKIKTKEE